MIIKFVFNWKFKRDTATDENKLYNLQWIYLQHTIL